MWRGFLLPMNFIALHRTDEAMTLLKRHPNAFLLLTQIAMRAKYKPCPVTKLEVGQAFIGDWREAGLRSEKAYRHAKCVLADCKFAAFKGATKGTVATLLNSTIYSITNEAKGEQTDSQGADQGRLTTKTLGHYIPPTPQGGAEEGDEKNPDGSATEWLPKGWRKFSEKRKSQTRVGFNTEKMNLIGKALGRRPSTLWTIAETEALLRIKPSDEEIQTILDYYLDEIPKETDYRRHNLATLLNNWNGELDRARAHKAAKRNPAA